MNFSDKGITYLLAAVAAGFAVGLFQGVLPMSAKARGWIAAVIIVAALTVLFVAPSSGEDFVAWFLIIGQGLIAWIVGLAIGAGVRLIAGRRRA